MSSHRCTFETRLGSVPTRHGPALMCNCGRWGMLLSGEWRVVPTDLLPDSCRALSRMHRAAGALLNCVIALTLGTLFALIVCPEAFL